MRIVPPGLAYRLAWLAGSLGFLVAGGRRRTILHNLAFLAPSLGRARHRALARRTFINLFEVAADLFRLPSLPPSVLDGLVEFHGQHHLDAAMAHGKGTIVVTPHLGAYELGAAVIAARGYDAHAMVEDLDPETNRALARYREATGLKLISRNIGVRSMYRLLAGGHVVLLAGDRIVGSGAEGLTVNFGTGLRRVPTGPAAFAVATGAPIVVGYVTLSPRGDSRYQIHLEPPIFPTAAVRSPEAIRNLTSRIAERLSVAVMAHPDQWFVFQPQWLPRDYSA